MLFNVCMFPEYLVVDANLLTNYSAKDCYYSWLVRLQQSVNLPRYYNLSPTLNLR